MSYILLPVFPLFLALLLLSAWCFWRAANPDFKWRIPALILGSIIPLYFTVLSNSGFTLLFALAGLGLSWYSGRLALHGQKKLVNRIIIIVSTACLFISALAVAFS